MVDKFVLSSFGPAINAIVLSTNLQALVCLIYTNHRQEQQRIGRE
jgi:hypothetical protein